MTARVWWRVTDTLWFLWFLVWFFAFLPHAWWKLGRRDIYDHIDDLSPDNPYQGWGTPYAFLLTQRSHPDYPAVAEARR